MSGAYGGLQGLAGLEAVIGSDGVTRGMVSDWFGNTVGHVAAPGGAMSWSAAQFLAWGAAPGWGTPPQVGTKPLHELLGYRGLTVDPTGYVQQGLRAYDPQVGRWLSPDPVGHAGSLSLYDYCDNDPLNVFDPDGRFGKGVYSSISSGVSSAYTSISNTFSSVKSSAQTSIYQYQIRTNTDVANMLQQKEQYVNDWATANDVDSNLVRATILHESRGWGDVFQPVQNQLSWIKSGYEGSYGYAQLGYKPRQEAHLEIEQAETMEGSIKGAAIWLAVSKNDLKLEGIANPTNAQIASQYNSRRQLGEVGSYGKQVQWTYDQIKAGTLKNLRPQEGSK
jgi:RHS repeat-associated protein